MSYSLGIVATAINPTSFHSEESSSATKRKSPKKKRKIDVHEHRRRVNGQLFEFLPDIPLAQFMTDIRNSPQFSLETTTDHREAQNNHCLSVFLRPGALDPLDAIRNVASKYRLLQRFFVLPTLYLNPAETNPANEMDWEMASSKTQRELSDDTVCALYQQLRDAHSQHTVNRLFTEAKPPLGLSPTLRFYQLDALNWMLDRELNTHHFPADFVEITTRTDPSQRFFFNAITLHLADELPDEEVAMPTGGILADEMGLGKTVEMLALILTNRRKIQANPNEENTQVVKAKVGELFVQ